MNDDRDPQDLTTPTKVQTLDFLTHIRRIPLFPRILLYILVMAIIGTALGEVKYRLEASNCMQKADCWIVDPARRRIRELGVGAIGGIFAATLTILPILLPKK